MKEKYIKGLSEEALGKELIKSCGIKSLSRAELAQMIRSNKMDTTIFSSFGAYFGQSAATILATKSDDMKNHRLIKNSSGELEIICDSVMENEKGFC